MTTATEVVALLRFHPATQRISCFGQAACTITDPTANAVIVSAQLLDPDTKEPSDKWLLLQLQPVDAQILAKAITKTAKERGWPEPDVEIVKTPFSGGSTKH